MFDNANNLIYYCVREQIVVKVYKKGDHNE